jgi:hypothetical protein
MTLSPKFKKLGMHLLGAFLTLAIVSSIWTAVATNRRANELEAENSVLMQINDSTQARVAKAEGDRNQYRSLYEAEKALNGELMAAVNIRVPADTIYVPVTEVATEYDSTGTRTAAVRDTADNGALVNIDVTAEPFPAPLQVGYEVVWPEFNPQVGFVRTGDSYTAVVKWGDQEFTLEDAFFVEETEKPLSLLLGAEAFGVPSEESKIGASIFARVYGAAEYRVTDRWSAQAQIGYAGDPYLGVRAEWRVW